jgi:hypothetical protein
MVLATFWNARSTGDIEELKNNIPKREPTTEARRTNCLILDLGIGWLVVVL